MDPIPKPQDNRVEVPSTLSSVNVRTMESDMESIKTTGGTHPIAQVVDTAPVFENESAVPEKKTEPSPSLSQKTTWGWFWIGLFLIIVFLAGYFILPLFV